MEKRTLLVATDGSPAATAAAAEAVALASALGARLVFVHASSPLAEDLFDEDPMDGPSQERILARDPVLAEATRRADEQEVECEVEVISAVRGSADLAADIAGIASGRDASMIVTGSRGRGTVAGAVLGSLSHNLIKEATVPVLVVHASEEGGA
jgi:nucleotide-binding universal stress UspA family protein